MHHPQLYLGLIGFEADEHARACRWLADNANQARQQAESADALSHPVWMPVDFQEADALLICGAGVEHGWRTQMQFKPALRKAAGTPLGLMLDDLKTPYAISDAEHLKSVGVHLGSQPLFDVRQEISLLKSIQYFENVLRPLRSLYATAVELTARQNELDAAHTFHLEHNGTLHAIVDVPQLRVMLSPSARPVDIAEAAWLRRPRSANFAPAQFLECNFEEIAWVFAQHNPTTALPSRYQTKPIHLKRSPRLRGSLLVPRHAALLERMSQGACTLAQLQLAMPGHASMIERDLYALYLTRAISTQMPQGSKGNSATSNGHSDLEQSSPWILDRMSRRLSTISDELRPLF
jgi:hypothetical protein